MNEGQTISVIAVLFFTTLCLIMHFRNESIKADAETMKIAIERGVDPVRARCGISPNSFTQQEFIVICGNTKQ